MCKLPQIFGLATLFLISDVAISEAETCPPCPHERPYCINDSHCEVNPPELRSIFKPVEVYIDGKRYIIAPKDQVTIKVAPDK